MGIKSKMKNKNNKSENFQNRIRIVKKSDKRADRVLKKERLANAEKVLNNNLDTGTKNLLNYDLLLAIEKKRDNYSGVISILEDAINYSDNKEKYKKLRKKIIMNKILSDMYLIEDNGNTAKLG